MSGFYDNSIDVAPPTGTIIIYAGTSDPVGWIICNGREVSRIDYVKLFNVISTSYGGGNGSTTFNLPDLRSKVIRGREANLTNSINNTINGNDSVTLTINNMPSHTHELSNHTHTIESHSHPIDGHSHSIEYHSHTFNDAYYSENLGTNSSVFGAGRSGTWNQRLRWRNLSNEIDDVHPQPIQTGGPNQNTDNPVPQTSDWESADLSITTVTTGSNGNSTPLTIIPSNITMNYIIKL